MGGGTGSRGHSPLLMVGVLFVTAGAVLVPGAPASAAPVCQTESATPGQKISDLPWAQQWLAPERLAPLATGAGVTVAVIDSGVDATHAQLKGRVTDGADFLDSSGDGQLDCVGHGTEVSSIIAAKKVNGVEFVGLAPGATILPLRISEKQELVDGTATGQTVSAAGFADAIDYAVEHGADIINLSVVLYKDIAVVRAAIARAVAADVLVVAAAGNLAQRGNQRPYPASYPDVIGVGAIGSDGTKIPESQTGDYVDLVAPGGAVTASATGGGQTVVSGTSFAAPFVAATAALLREYLPQLSPDALRRRITATADPAPGGRHSEGYGAGVVNPYRALTETVANSAPERATGLVQEQADPAVIAAQEHRDRTRRWAVWLAAGGAGIALLVLLGAAVIPRGTRRGWRPAARS